MSTQESADTLQLLDTMLTEVNTIRTTVRQLFSELSSKQLQLPPSKLALDHFKRVTMSIDQLQKLSQQENVKNALEVQATPTPQMIIDYAEISKSEQWKSYVKKRAQRISELFSKECKKRNIPIE